MLLGYPRKLVSKELQKLNIFVPSRQVTEKDVLLIQRIRMERLQENFYKSWRV
ncbi:hypothetical protein SPTER_27380 [Sporomusa termitida]|uniref:Uncharacterized protein n=1 Tax=Sporomusa termitida TaxID=2377 RepID=A0A517DVG5_9FIRM|nr:hypothetical protein SPTER_27380 [Sporomusa termitida]